MLCHPLCFSPGEGEAGISVLPEGGLPGDGEAGYQHLKGRKILLFLRGLQANLPPLAYSIIFVLGLPRMALFCDSPGTKPSAGAVPPSIW